MFSLGKISGAATLLAGLASAQNFRVVGEVYNGTPGDIWSLRTYYADGEVYMGQVIPDEVTTALNYTIPDWSGTAPNVVVAAVEPDTLPEGTFIAINNATGAADAVKIAHDEASLGEGEWVKEWLRYGTRMIPRNAGGESSTETGFFLEETSAQGTFKVKWRTPGQGGEDSQVVRLLAVL
ncbi:hypothetical protein N3K66_000216 [Trichothecium roseum]|uniref:Uncharacterized protein n=1 Tax=Trichothecium roseum TaxID=47278 RepID=A0ACC0VB70_9HYPO|nr:hypothetical protein N3K66_000216 [Trichothecium roseum]